MSIFSHLLKFIFQSFSERSKGIWGDIMKTDKSIIQGNIEAYSLMSQEDLSSCVKNAEKLNLQLKLEFNKEVGRAEMLGISR